MEPRPKENSRRKRREDFAGRTDTSEPPHMENGSDKPYNHNCGHIPARRSDDQIRESDVIHGLGSNGTECCSDMVARKGISPAMVAVDRSRPHEYDTLRNAGIMVDDSPVRAVHIIGSLRIPSLETQRKIHINNERVRRSANPLFMKLSRRTQLLELLLDSEGERSERRLHHV